MHPPHPLSLRQSIFFGEGLTAMTVLVATRVVMNLRCPEVLTDCLVSAHHRRLASQNGRGDLVGGKGMAEGVGSNGTVPAQPLKVFLDIDASRTSGDGRIRFLSWKKPSSRFSVSSPIGGEDIQSSLRQQGIPIRPVLRTADKEAFLLAFDVFVAEMTNLADAKA